MRGACHIETCGQQQRRASHYGRGETADLMLTTTPSRGRMGC
jgi:hypothetical protein